MNKTIKNLDFCEETINQKHLLEMGWLELCGRLKEIRDNKLYEGRWDNFEDFLIDPQMGLDKGSASKMITIHEKFIIEYKMSPEQIARVGGWSKVAEILPGVKNKKSAEVWMDKAAALSKADLRREIKEEKNPDSIDCKHKHTRKLTLLVCEDCDHKEEYHA